MVLNNVWDNRVSEETRERVLRATEELGYIPHALARSLRAGQTNLVLMPFFDWPYNLDSLAFIQELSSQIEELGYTVMLQMSRPKSIRAAAQAWAALRPTGVIFPVTGLTSQTVDIMYKAGTKAIMAFGETATKLAPTVVTDFTPVGECAAQYLIERGHRRLAAVVPRDPRILQIGLQRFQGFKQTAESHGLQIERLDLAYNFEETRQLVSGWKQGPHPTGIFTFSDDYGLMLMRVLQDAGLRVPEDIALVGCDNLPLCELVRPRFTSIQISAFSVAEAVATFFDDLIQGRTGQNELIIRTSPTLMSRESA
jgi:DNA-binding LacI/PurR family transcriptional regulator